MANPYFNDPAYGWNTPYNTAASLPGAFPDPTQTGGILGGSGGGRGPLGGGSGGGFGGLRAMLADPSVMWPMAAQLIGGATPQASFAGALGAAGPAFADMRQRAAINAWLKSRSTGQPLSPEIQQYIAQNPALASKLAEHDLGLDTAGDRFSTGLAPQWVQDAKGNWHQYLMDRSGVPKEVRYPPGSKLSPPVTTIDTGTGTQTIFKQGGGPAGPVIPKDVAGAASQKTIGEAQGAAAVNLPVVEDAARRLTGTIDEALAKPEEISRVTGPLQSMLPNVSGTAHAGQAILNQIQGQTFLQAYQQLKGGGAITDLEGSKATAALNKLSETGVEDAQYIKYLQEFKEEVQKLVDLARRKAAAGVPAGAPAAGAADPLGIR